MYSYFHKKHWHKYCFIQRCKAIKSFYNTYTFLHKQVTFSMTPLYTGKQKSSHTHFVTHYTMPERTFDAISHMKYAAKESNYTNRKWTFIIQCESHFSYIWYKHSQTWCSTLAVQPVLSAQEEAKFLNFESTQLHVLAPKLCMHMSIFLTCWQHMNVNLEGPHIARTFNNKSARPSH